MYVILACMQSFSQMVDKYPAIGMNAIAFTTSKHCRGEFFLIVRS